MRLRPENLAEMWRGTKREILDNHTELVDIRAGDLAAARLFNWFQEDWAALRDEVRNAFLAGSLGGDDERLQVFRSFIDWTPLRELERLSGSRRIIRDLDHPIVVEGSTPPANILAVTNYWRTDRIADVDAIEDVNQVWKDIRAEFRGRAGGREGAILANHQGTLAIRTAFEILDLKPYGEFAGITCNLSDAEKTVDFFRHEAEVWPDDPGKNFSALADIFAEAISDALAHGKKAVAIIDTTNEGYEGPTLTFAKQMHRHEAFHVWENTINPEGEEMLAESVIMADPDYIVPETALAEYYPEITPDQIVSEAMAFISSGDWESAGFPEKAQALEYLDRYFISVVEEYGMEALDGLRLVHPDTKEVIDHVRASAKNDIGRAQESPGEGAGANGQTDGRAPSGRGKLRASQSRMVGGRPEEDGGGLRRDSQESGEIRSSGRRIDLSHPDTEIGFYPAADISQAAKGGRFTTALPQITITTNGHHQSRQGIAVSSIGLGAECGATGSVKGEISITNSIQNSVDEFLKSEITSLRRIAEIESIDPRYTWRDLAEASVRIAREALAESVRDQEAARSSQNAGFLAALERISGIEALDAERYSWRDKVQMVQEIAREALAPAGLQRESGQEESLSLQVADRDRSGPDALSLSDIRGRDRGYEENDHGQSFSI